MPEDKQKNGKSIPVVPASQNSARLVKRTVPYLLESKAAGRKLVALTSYDYIFTKLLDSTGEVDLLLVGDSLASIIHGQPNTLGVTLNEIIYHTRCVARAAQYSVVVADLPFMTYQVSPEKALQNAGRVIKESGAQAVKLEGGVNMAETIARIVAVDIPVVGHIGLTPQSYHRMGGHKIQGKKKSAFPRSQTTKAQLLDDAKAVADAGAFLLVLEGIPSTVAAEITASIDIPTIGIGAGAECDGQILVTHDMLGFQQEGLPKFVKCFRSLGEEIQSAVKEYATETRGGEFPGPEHSIQESSEPKMAMAKKA